MLVQFQHFILITSLFHSLTKVAVDAQAKAPALYVFGDSLLDAGNNNWLPTLAKANYYPYGIDFSKGFTGRFTNSRTVADYIAEFVDVPYPPPAYNLGSPTTNWHTGYNYASATCGILDETGSHLGKCLNMNDQLNLFEMTINSILKVRFVNPTELALYLSKSIFIVCIGSNDYLSNYLDWTYDTRTRYTSKQFAKLLVTTFSSQIQRLYKLGARKMLIFELGPLGCVPHITKTTKHSGVCNEEVNKMVKLYNKGWKIEFSRLRSTLPNSHFVLGRTYRITYEAVIHPSKYGLTNSRDTCCLTWLNTTLCIPGSLPCLNHQEYFFWDAYHPTQTVSYVIASRCVNGTDVCNPNLQQLVRI